MAYIKFIVVNAKDVKKKNIFRLEPIVVENNIKLLLKIYSIDNNVFIDNSMLDSINESSDALSIFNILPTNEILSFVLSIKTCYEILFILEADLKKFKLQDINETREICVKNTEIKLTISKISYIQLKMLIDFIEFFTKNYELIKNNLFNKESILPQPQIQTEQNEIVSIKNVNVNNTILDKLFYQNNADNYILKYYCFKVLINQKNVFECNTTQNEFNIKFTSPIKFHLYSISYLNDLNLIIKSLCSLDFETHVNKFKNYFDIFIRLLLNNEHNSELCNILIFLMFIHARIIIIKKQSNNNIFFTLDENLKKFFINTMTMCFQKIKSYKNITQSQINMTLIETDINNTNTIKIDKLEELKEKYAYLINIDNEQFLLNINNELNTSDTLDKKLILPKTNCKKILNIDTFLQNIESNIFNYKLISDNKFPNNTIITEQYQQILKISMFKTKSINNLDEVVSKLYDTIYEHIFVSLINDEDNIIKFPDTFYLLTKHIDPFLSDNIEINIRLIVLYKCIIPYLYDKMKISQFLDCFN